MGSNRSARAPAVDIRIKVEADGARTLPLEVDVLLVTEEAAEALLRRWEDRARRGLPLRLPAVLLLREGAGGAAGGSTGEGGAIRGGRDAPPLAPRESEVLRLLARGAGNKQIAMELGVSEHTIKFHTSAISRCARRSGRSSSP